MSKELNATCQICGKRYHMCKSCETNKGVWESWKQYADTKDCFKIFTILYDRRVGKITDAEAVKALKECDLSELDTFESEIKEIIKGLVGSKAVVKESKSEEKVDKKIEEVEEKIEDVKKKKSIASKLSL